MNWYKVAATPKQPPPTSMWERYLAWVWRTYIRPHVAGTIKRYQFREWLDPNHPSYNKWMREAIQRQDWQQLLELVRVQRGQLKTHQGLYDHPYKMSNHEFVVRDIFAILNIGFGYQQEMRLSNGKNIVVDFILEDGRVFEIFGYNSRRYRLEAYEKTQELEQDIWWMDVMRTNIRANDVTLTRYATLLDSSICHKFDCGLSLFKFSVEEELHQRVPLLLGQNFSMCRNYLIQLARKGKYWLQRKREEAHDQPGLFPEEPEYAPTLKPQNGWEHPITQPLPEHMKPQTSKVANWGPPTLNNIEASLNSRYWSSDMWSDEEKVAVYFKTPEALMTAMNGQQGLAMTARNWYGKVRWS